MENVWLNLLKICNVQTTELNNANILEVVTSNTNRTIQISLSFPKVVSIEALKELITKVNAYFQKDGISHVFFDFEYENYDISSEYLNAYYVEAIKDCSMKNNMVGILDKYSKKVEDNCIKFVCATLEEKNTILDVLKTVNEYFYSYGLKVLLSVDISSFEISISEKYRIKKEIERKQYETIEQEKYRQKLVQQQVQTEEFK